MATEIYALPNATDNVGLFEFFSYINNTLTDGLFFPSVMAGIWFIAFIISTGLTRANFPMALTISSFITSVLMMPMIIMGFINWTWGIFPVIMLGLGLALVILGRSKL